MNVGNTHISGRFWGLWTLASAAATTVVWAIAFPLMASAGEPASASTGAAVAILFGLALGVAQWLVLRKHVPGSGRWVAITLVSLALAIGLALSLDGEGRELLAFGAAGLLAGALTGLGMARMLGDAAPVASGGLSDA